MSVSSITMVASVVYLYANSLSDAALLKDSVAILFLNDIDEQVFEIVSRLMPGWVERLEQDIKNYETDMNNPTFDATDINGEDRSLMQVESVVDASSVVSRVEATANLLREGRNYHHNADGNATENRNIMPQDISVIFAHIENLNDQIRELHRVIEDLRNTEINDIRREVRTVKSHICL